MCFDQLHTSVSPLSLHGFSLPVSCALHFNPWTPLIAACICMGTGVPRGGRVAS